MVNVGGVTEALALHRPPVVTSPSILAHGNMPWESRTMMVVAVQGAPCCVRYGIPSVRKNLLRTVLTGRNQIIYSHDELNANLPESSRNIW